MLTSNSKALSDAVSLNLHNHQQLLTLLEADVLHAEAVRRNQLTAKGEVVEEDGDDVVEMAMGVDRHVHKYTYTHTHGDDHPHPTYSYTNSGGGGGGGGDGDGHGDVVNVYAHHIPHTTPSQTGCTLQWWRRRPGQRRLSGRGENTGGKKNTEKTENEKEKVMMCNMHIRYI